VASLQTLAEVSYAAMEERDQEDDDFQSINLLRRVSRGTAMVFVICGIAVAAGIGCAFLRHPVFALIVLCSLLAAGALLSGIHFGVPAELIGVEVFGSIAAPHMTFVAVSLARFSFRLYLARSSKLIPQVRTAIGQQLRAELEVPGILSPDLARLVSQLSFA
jgi:hypothetical protein